MGEVVEYGDKGTLKSVGAWECLKSRVSRDFLLGFTKEVYY